MKPTPIQVEALDALARTRRGRHKAGLVVMATGLGKTVLSALFAEKFKRVLFVAHKDEILSQAEAAFGKVNPARAQSRFDGKTKDLSGDVVFASVLAIRNQLRKGRAPKFDLLIVDEFHHAAADSYREILERLNPKFLLGLTATPERTDRQDILELCGGNEVYRCDLSEAIRRKALAPVRYFGIDDTIDFEPIPWRGGRYDLDAVASAAATEERAQEALQQWLRLAGDRTLAFCCTVAHAEFMHAYFEGFGIPCALVHGGTPKAERRQALQDLADASIGVLFSVDVFNEGVDVPNIDTVLMLRPTDSEIVWRQQVGRGLRKAKGKTHVTVIDFIGNHEKFKSHIERIVRHISGRELTNPRQVVEKQHELPEGCSVEIGELRLVEEWLKEKDYGALQEETARLWAEGLNCTQIGERLEVPLSTVLHWLRKRGHDTSRGASEETSEETIDEAVRLWTEEGLSARKIGERLGLSYNTVCRWLRKRGHNTRQGASEETIDEAVRLWTEEGLSTTQIGKRLGAASRSVCRWLRKRGHDARHRRAAS